MKDDKGLYGYLRIRIARKRRPEAEGLNIASMYSREFTGTAAFNRKEIEAARERSGQKLEALRMKKTQ